MPSVARHRSQAMSTLQAQSSGRTLLDRSMMSRSSERRLGLLVVVFCLPGDYFCC
ncbi:hypothetical protein SLEP1_g25186 [Rubroshorea leprosula]|uniref:Uncharacterized protein n=1 Tax=Rubroshorea leprosula TaxID=152421 RepID=A0AAV5JSK3_9ROSI|nr:hypothetical protein SLEP1_g25186 [Rubroshorea leprosula]